MLIRSRLRINLRVQVMPLTLPNMSAIAPSINLTSAKQLPSRPRDDKGRLMSLESIAMQSVDSQEHDGKAWIADQIRELMRASVRLCSMALPRSIERMLIREKLMLTHLERGMKLFGLGEHAGKHTLILCADSAIGERFAKRALEQAMPATPESVTPKSAPASLVLPA